MTFSIIQKSQLEGALRLDAEYYQPEYLEVTEKLNRVKTTVLGNFCRIADGDHSALPGFVESDGIRYLRAKDLENFFINNSDSVFISNSYFKKIKRSHIKPFDIVLSIMGTVGNLAIILPQNGTITANRAVAIISPKSQDLFSSFFVATYLESKFGVKQRERESMGGVQQRVNLDDLTNLKIPLVAKNLQNEVDKVFQEAILQREATERFYSQAENLLLEKLGLKEFKKELEEKSELCWTVNYSDVKEANRIDAEYFQPKYQKLISKLKSQNAEPLLEVLENMAAKFDAAKQPDTTFNYIELADVDSSIGIISGSSEVLGKGAPSRAKRVLKKGDVIVSSIQGSLQKAALIDKTQDGFLASTGFFQFRSKTILPEVLLVLAKSFIFQMQLEKQCAGTILTAVPHESLKNIAVPILPLETQQKIADLVKQSHLARQKSKELLEEAKRKVEKMIEGKNEIASKE